MKDEERLRFPHRKNHSSSFDSICPRCFRTISQKETEAELRQDEEDHVCEIDSLGYRRNSVRRQKMKEV
jgi:hypothetical protein